jgi:hypothetical protein
VLVVHQPVCRHSGPWDRYSSHRPSWGQHKCPEQQPVPAPLVRGQHGG